jgi:hypothetical protein
MGLNRIGIPISHHGGRVIGRGMIDEKSLHVDDLVAFKQAHFAVLQ